MLAEVSIGHLDLIGVAGETHIVYLSGEGLAAEEVLHRVSHAQIGALVEVEPIHALIAFVGVTLVDGTVLKGPGNALVFLIAVVPWRASLALETVTELRGHQIHCTVGNRSNALQPIRSHLKSIDASFASVSVVVQLETLVDVFGLDPEIAFIFVLIDIVLRKALNAPTEVRLLIVFLAMQDLFHLHAVSISEIIPLDALQAQISGEVFVQTGGESRVLGLNALVLQQDEVVLALETFGFVFVNLAVLDAGVETGLADEVADFVLGEVREVRVDQLFGGALFEVLYYVGVWVVVISVDAALTVQLAPKRTSLEDLQVDAELLINVEKTAINADITRSPAF